MKKILLSFLVLTLCSCSSSKVDGFYKAKEVKDVSITLDENVKDKMTNFSLDSIEKIKKDGNLVFSPISHFMSSASMYSISSSTDFGTYLKLFGVNSQEELIDLINNVYLNLYETKKDQTIKLSNALLFSGNPKEEILEVLNEDLYYTVIDYQNEKIQKSVNEWINSSTNGLKTEFSLENYKLDSNEELIFLNALYLDLSFYLKFSVDSNQEKTFYNNNITPVTKTFMNNENYATYYSNQEDYQSFALKLLNGQVHFMLPKESKTIADILENYQLEEIFNLHCAPERLIKGNVSLPKFEIETKLDLKDLYQKQNLNFVNYQCKLTNNVYENLSLSQENVVTLNEDGFKATSLNINYQYPTQEEEFDICLNRPFSFLIEDNNGLIVYYGELHTL